jgi:hypothetical protein
MRLTQISSEGYSHGHAATRQLCLSKREQMNLVLWLPGLFVLGVVSLAACLAFTEGCAKI